MSADRVVTLALALTSIAAFGAASLVAVVAASVWLLAVIPAWIVVPCGVLACALVLLGFVVCGCRVGAALGVTR